MYHPITNPAISPDIRQRYMSSGVATCPYMINYSGRSRKTWPRPSSSSRVDSSSCTLRVPWILSLRFTYEMSVATMLVRMQARMPIALQASGTSSIERSLLLELSVSWSLEITRAAQVAYANEPNRSAPIPAMSPTLSPTLSAIVAGLHGESSAKPASIFPTRSAPTSAAFV